MKHLGYCASIRHCLVPTVPIPDKSILGAYSGRLIVALIFFLFALQGSAYGGSFGGVGEEALVS